MVLYGYVFGIGYGLMCLLLALVVYKCGVPKKYTRKIVHILVGFEWVILYHFMGAGLHFLIVCLAFLALLLVAYFTNLFPMISSDSDNALGTVYYAVAMTGVAICAMFFEDVMIPFGMAIACTSLGDGMAGVVGQAVKNHNPKIYKNKSLFGTISNFVFSFIGVFLIDRIYGAGLGVFPCFALALLSALLELITEFGLDNIVITWCVAAFGYLFTLGVGWDYAAPILLTPVVIWLTLSHKALTRSGIVAAIIVDVVISIGYKNFGFILLLSFFALGVVVDKIKKKIRSDFVDEGKKGECRDAVQVFANSVVAALCALGFIFKSGIFFTVGFVAALSEALADTVASGFGALAKRTFDPFRFKPTEGGISGGMSVLGTFAALVGSFTIGVIAYAFGRVSFKALLITTAAGFLGSIFDSFLGSLAQVKYRCGVCGKITERHIHCSERTQRHSGLPFIDNDVVNLLSCLFSVAFATALYYLMA